MIKKLLIAFLTVFIYVGSAVALDVPGYKGYVNDFASMLTSEQSATLEKKLVQYEKETSNQVAILTVPSLEGDSLEDFSIRVVENWKVGQKGKDNGVLILSSSMIVKCVSKLDADLKVISLILCLVESLTK